MIKTIGIVSLSAGTIGEDFVSHEVKIGLKRLEDYGLKVKFLPNALKGRKYKKRPLRLQRFFSWLITLLW